MKTVIFSNDPKVIEEHKKAGEIIVVKDPVKTLKAMKGINSKADYRVVGDEKYVKFAQQLGYNQPEPKTSPSLETIGKLTDLYEQQLKDKENEYKQKLEDYDRKIAEMQAQQESRLKELEKEKSLIKKTIKKILVADE